MKKVYFTLFLSLVFLFLFSISSTVKAQIDCSETYRGGIVPCGIMCHNPLGGAPVPCGTCIGAPPDAPIPGLCIAKATELECPCQIEHVFELGSNIFVFIVWNITIPLGGLILLLGGLLILVSGGNQGILNTGKNMVKYSIIAVAIILFSWLIIDVVLRAIGYIPIGTPWYKF